jgi:Flp pilus assembly protein TadD
MVQRFISPCRWICKAARILLLCSALLSAGQQTLLSIQDAIGSGNLDAASQLLQTALQSHPNDAGLLNLRGVVHAERGEVDDAQRDFSRAVELSPDLMSAWQNLGRACQLDSSNACAERAWKRVLRWHPANAEAHKGLAVALQRSGHYAESLQTMAGVPEKQTWPPASWPRAAILPKATSKPCVLPLHPPASFWHSRWMHAANSNCRA